MDFIEKYTQDNDKVNYRLCAIEILYPISKDIITSNSTNHLNNIPYIAKLIADIAVSQDNTNIGDDELNDLIRKVTNEYNTNNESGLNDEFTDKQ